MLERLVELIIKQRTLVLLLTALIVVVGVYSWQNMEIDAFPDATNIQVMILAEAPGWAAVDVERQITYPIEWTMTGLPYVLKVRSLSKAGLSQVVVVFEDFVDIYFARQVVLERLQLARENLPKDIDPEMGPISTGLGEIYQYTLESEAHNPMELRTIQDWIIAPQLRTIPGVTEVNSFGGFVMQYHVEVLPAKLLKFGLTLRDVFEAVENNNANVGGNYIIKGWEQSYVRSIGLFTNIGDIENVVLKSKDGTPVLLKDIAEVKIGPETRQGTVTRDGKGERVAGMVIMLKGANSKDVVDRVKQKIPSIQASLPEGVKIDTFYDRTFLIQACINNMTSALLIGGILVILVLFVFLWNLRAGLIVALALPLSALITFGLMKWSGLTANLMSLGGLAIAIGMIVDGSIVVTENIIRFMTDPTSNSSNITALIIQSTKEVIRPVLFSILIIIVVFFPIFTLEQVEGKMFKPLALTVCLAMLASLIVSLVIIPVLCSFFFKKMRSTGDPLFLRLLKKLHHPLLVFALKHRVIVVIGSVALIIASLGLLLNMGTEFIPQLDEGAIAINVVRLPSASLEGSKTVAEAMERRILKSPEVDTVVCKTGRAEISEDPMGPEQTDVFIMLKPRGDWRSGLTKSQLVEEINQSLKQIPGISLSFSQPIALRVNELISGIKSDLAIKIFGDDLDLLCAKGAEISQVLGRIDGAHDIKLEQVSGFSQVNIEIDRTAIARHKINVSDINEVIETAVGGKIATWFMQGRQKFAVLVRFPLEARKDIQTIGRILIPSPAGYHVPLSNLARINEVEGPAQISHEKNMRRIVVECNIRERDIGSFVAEAQDKNKSIEASLPPGYFIEYGGQFENQQRVNKKLMLVVPMSILLIFLLLYASFGSVGSALLVILNIPFALIGGVFALYLSGQYLSVPSSIGFIAIFGVAVENGVLLVSYIRRLRMRGVALSEAVLQGAVLRLRPVLMTTATTICGLIPLMISVGVGAEVQRPLATVVIGGLITSTILTLLVLPCLYGFFEGKTRPQS